MVMVAMVIMAVTTAMSFMAVMMLMMMVTSTVFPVVMMMVMPAVIFQKLFYLRPMPKRPANGFPAQFLPWCGNNCRIFVFLTEHMDSFLNLLV